jgi:hypothetical protein
VREDDPRGRANEIGIFTDSSTKLRVLGGAAVLDLLRGQRCHGRHDLQSDASLKAFRERQTCDLKHL